MSFLGHVDPNLLQIILVTD